MSSLAAISTIRNFLSKFLDGFNELSNWPLNSQFIYFMQCKRHRQRLFSSSKNEVLFRWWKKIIVKLSVFWGHPAVGITGYQMKIRFVEEKPKVALCVISTGRIFKANRVIMKTKENLHVIWPGKAITSELSWRGFSVQRVVKHKNWSCSIITLCLFLSLWSSFPVLIELQVCSSTKYISAIRNCCNLAAIFKSVLPFLNEFW